MGMDTSKFTIKVPDLAEALEIKVSKLIQIIEFFDSDDKDEWELKEGDHFIYSNKRKGERIFSELGAYAIAKYMDTHEKKSLWDKIVEFITKHKEKLRNAFIARKVHENSSSLIRRNSQHFLSKKDVVSILCTSPARLNRAFKDIQRSDSPMMIGRDFDDIDGTRYYSLSGFVALSKELGDKLTMKDRREWCKAVKVTGQKTLRQIADAADRHSKAVEKAKNRARERDNEVCQITGKKYESYQDPPMRFAVHHIFSEAHYPHLATSLDNLITVSEALHTEFHAWNGGTNAPCDADKLIDFVCERYPEYQEKALERLYQVRKVFGTQAPTTPPKRLKQKKAS